jgi:hypothetical protein
LPRLRWKRILPGDIHAAFHTDLLARLQPPDRRHHDQPYSNNALDTQPLQLFFPVTYLPQDLSRMLA